MTAARAAAKRRPLRWLVTGVCVCATCLGGAAAASGQSTTSTLQGIVVDPSNAVLPSATITLTSSETGSKRGSRSSKNGSFRISVLTPGRYQLTVSLAGFASYEGAIELAQDRELTLQIMLALAHQPLSVDVVATESPLVEPSKTSLGRTITTREINDLPIPGRQFQTFQGLATLTPGILADESTLGISTAGQGVANNTFLIDGLSIDDAVGAPLGANGGSLPVDAIKEFTVVSNHFSPEYGQASGAVVNVLTRSGTNTPSARLYYFHQDSAWNATSAPARQVGAKDPQLQTRTVGGFWGGPVVRNRVFFFGSAEQVATNTGYTVTSPAVSLFRPDDPLTQPADFYTPKVFGRIDSNLTASNALTLRYRYWEALGYNAAHEPLSAAERSRDVTDREPSVAVLDTHVFRSAAVNELRLQRGRRSIDFNVDRFCATCVTLNYPSILLGKQANSPQSNLEDRWQLADAFTALLTGWGLHTLKVGVDASVFQSQIYFPSNFSGTYKFPNDLPFDPLNKKTYPTRFTQNDGNPRVHLRESITAIFAQDEWKPREALTVNLGVRWDRTAWPGPSGHRDDVAPRLGLSIDPWNTGTTVFRAGLGRYYDETSLVIARNAEIGFGQTTIANPGFQADAIDPDPFGFNPNRTGPVLPRFSTTQAVATQTPYTDQVSVGLQRQIGHDVGLTVDLVRALGHRLPIQLDLNYPDPTTHLRPDPTIDQIIVTETGGQSWYTGLQAGLRRRFARGYAYSLAYTWSSSENDTDGPQSFPQNSTNVLGDRGPTPNDSHHRLSASAMLTLPFGCRLATLVTAHSGLPYDITTGNDDNKDLVFNDRPPGQGRNSGRGSAWFDEDVRVSRLQRFGARQVELLIEAFNVTNHANWLVYNGNQSSVSFGRPSAAGPPRQIQIGVRFDF
jgi:hypothetical protein